MKGIDWQRLIRDLTEELVCTQGELAEKIGSTQQSISNWSTNIRCPSKTKSKALLKLLKETNLVLEDYLLNDDSIGTEELMNTFLDVSPKIRRLIYKIHNLSARKRKEILVDLTNLIKISEAKK